MVSGGLFMKAPDAPRPGERSLDAGRLSGLEYGLALFDADGAPVDRQ